MRRALQALMSALLAVLMPLTNATSSALGAPAPLVASGDYALFNPPTITRTCMSGVGVTRITVALPYDTSHLHASLPLQAVIAFYDLANPSGETFLQGDVESAVPSGRAGTQLFEFDIPGSDAAYDTGQVMIDAGQSWSVPVARETFPMQCGSQLPWSVTLPALTRNNICGDTYMKVDNRLGTLTWYDFDGSVTVGPNREGAMPIVATTSTSTGGFEIATKDSTGQNAAMLAAVLGNPPCQLGVFSVLRAGPISGTLRVGYRLTAHPSTLRVPATHISYRWLRNGSFILGASTSTYLLRGADRTAVISVRITYSRPDYRTWTQPLRTVRRIS